MRFKLGDKVRFTQFSETVSREERENGERSRGKTGEVVDLPTAVNKYYVVDFNEVPVRCLLSDEELEAAFVGLNRRKHV